MKFLPAILSLLSVASAIQARTIDINLHIIGQDTVTTGETAGHVPVAGVHWNNIGFTAGSGAALADVQLKDDNGTATAARFESTLGSAFMGSSGATGPVNGDRDMMASYLSFRAADPGLLRISDLGTDFTSPGYQVYVYFDTDATNRTHTITLTPSGEPAMPISGDDSGTYSGTFVQAVGAGTAGNLAVFTGLSSPSFVIEMDSNIGRGAVNGIQVVSNNHPATPVISSFEAASPSIPSGSSTTLSWDSAGATSLSIAPDVGDVTGISTDGTGSIVVTPTATTTYTLTATNAIGASSATVTVREVAPGSRPNILFFLVDDMGWQDSSQPFHSSTTLLNQRFRTPNMEALALQGRRFTQAYACSVCSPTRVSLMTGMNAARHKVTNWTLNPNSDQSGTTATLRAPSLWNINGMGPEAETATRVLKTDQTLPKILNNAGYRTIHCGKAHFGANSLLGEDPLNIGFDVNIAGHAAGGPASYYGTSNFGSGEFHVPGLEQYHGQDIFLTEALTLEINKSIEDAVDDGVPFFAYMAHYAVHVPLAEDSRFSANYPGLDSTEKKYATMVEGMDKSLGDILAKVDALGVAENTLVIFYSDNGGISFSARGSSPYGGINTHNWPLRAGKGSAYEGGTRVPFIAAWAKPDPANAFQQNYPIPENTISDSPVIIEDLMPTVLTAAGITPPEEIDGFDISGYIQDTPGFQRPDDSLLFHYPHVWTSGAIGQNQGYEPYSALRDGDWKIIYLYHNTRWELYHLPSDIDENNDLTATNPDKFMEMTRKMIRLLEERGAQYPENRNTSQPIPLVMPDLPAVDLDGDGIPDNTEDPNRNGLVDPGETDPDQADTDGDNHGDGAELKAGTDPLDSADSLYAYFSGDPASALALHWRSSPGRFYTIWTSETLAVSDWAIHQSNIPASVAQIETSSPLGASASQRKFFRVEVE
ncbi:MAG: arylsulfatase A-like enzyme [Verrucomicrobiales bacterium]|jgi:arylsulfatase A-like enzyme